MNTKLMSRMFAVTAAGVVALGTACGLQSNVFYEDDGTSAEPDAAQGRDDAERDVRGERDGSEVADVAVEPVATSLRIEPATVELTTELGVAVEQAFGLSVVLSDGTERPVGGEVVWQAPADCAVSPEGVATYFGGLPGPSQIVARAEGLEAIATVNLHVNQVVVADGLDPGIVDTIGAAPPAAAGDRPAWVYPENETMYPAGLTPPLFQWNAGSSTVHHISVVRGDALRFDIYTTQNSWRPTGPQWRAMASAYGEPIIVELSGIANPAAPELLGTDMRILFTADADLAGAVYYWQVETGDIMRIPQGAEAPERVFSTNAESGNCRGCHTITRDGGRLGFMYNGGDNPRAGLAWSSAPEPAILDNGTGYQWTGLAFDPAGRRAVAIYGGTFWLADTTPGLAGGVANLGTLDGLRLADRACAHPTWSPDGSTLAYISRDPGSADWSFAEGDLMLANYDAATQTFGVPRVLVPRGSTAETDTISYPTWSPDSNWIAYTQGPDNRGSAPSHLHLVDARTGATRQLGRAAPLGQDVFTSFSPYFEGGYYWLLFYSTRAYGHVTTLKQLWVAAIDADAPPGSDPSFAAFWLPGQDPARKNITGYWAPPACVNLDEYCKSDLDCCTGFTCEIVDGSRESTCQVSACVVPGYACAATEDCCPGSLCLPSLAGTLVCQRDPLAFDDD
jgi:hypothetical protein